MSRFQRVLIIFLSTSLAALSGCSQLVGTAIPTLLPSEYVPTAIALTVQAENAMARRTENSAAIWTPTLPVLPTPRPATNTPLPTAAKSPASPTAVPQVTATLLLTPIVMEDIPPARIQILGPGPASRVTTPFLLRVSLKPGPRSVVRIELAGENGQLLTRLVKNYDLKHNEAVVLAEPIDFAINGVAELGRLQISLEDEQRRLVSVASEDVLLLSLGDNDINQPVDGLENIVINAPKPNALIQGNMLRVSGLARRQTDQPLMIALQASDGKIVGTRQVTITSSPDSAYGTFAIDVPFQVSSPTRARLQVWEPGVRIPGIVNLSSVEVMLSP